jgi:hypothetical protein
MYVFLVESSRTNQKDYRDRGLSELIIPKSDTRELCDLYAQVPDRLGYRAMNL